MRPAAQDRALCLHEAAHAVAVEVLAPGTLTGIQMDVVPGVPDIFQGVVYSDGVDALTAFEYNTSTDDVLVILAAGREGELIQSDGLRYDHGDRKVMHWYGGPGSQRRARRRAKALVRRHELAIRRVAKAASERRVLSGHEVRGLML